MSELAATDIINGRGPVMLDGRVLGSRFVVRMAL